MEYENLYLVNFVWLFSVVILKPIRLSCTLRADENGGQRAVGRCGCVRPVYARARFARLRCSFGVKDQNKAEELEELLAEDGTSPKSSTREIYISENSLTMYGIIVVGNLLVRGEKSER